MSEQQTATATTTTANRNEPDYSEPTPERQAELRAAYEANMAAGKPPYERVEIRSLGELLWVVEERGWRPEMSSGMRPPQDVLIDFRGAYFKAAELRKVDLASARLSGAYFEGVDLREAVLYDADLRETTFFGGDLSKVRADNANLGGAILEVVHLNGASLRRTNLKRAGFFAVDLSDADLTEARLDGDTRLVKVGLSRRTRLLDVVWGATTFTSVDWSKMPRIGDELGPPFGLVSRAERYRDAARTYRGLSIALRSQGLLIPASNYRLREQIMERKAKLRSFNVLGWAFSWMLYLVAGYGERPARSFYSYLIVLFGFAAAYFALGSGWAAATFGWGVQDAVNTPLAALVFSVTSFHGRGFFPGSGFRLDDPLIVLAAIEAVIGLFIEITFIATFTQRFFGGR